MVLPTGDNVKSVEKQINVPRLEYRDFLFPLKLFQLSILLKKFQLVPTTKILYPASALGSIDRASFTEESDSLMGSDAGAAETHIGKVDSDIFHDSGVWNIPLSDSIRIEIVSRGPVDLQNKEGPFLSIEKPGSRG